MTLKRLRTVYGELVLYYAGKERPDKAMAFLRKMEKISPLTLVERAFEATLFLINHDGEKAEKTFRLVAQSFKIDESTDELYARLYSQSYLHGIRGEVVQQGYVLADALRVQVGPKVLRWLPLRDK